MGYGLFVLRLQNVVNFRAKNHDRLVSFSIGLFYSRVNKCPATHTQYFPAHEIYTMNTSKNAPYFFLFFFFCTVVRGERHLTT